MKSTFEFSLEIARQAGALIAEKRRNEPLERNFKGGIEIVTQADIAADDLISAAIRAAYPSHQILSEESSPDLGRVEDIEGPLWIIDPIDGTANFLRGVPIWATLIALTVAGKPVLGMVSAPALGQQWWGAEGLGAWTRTTGDREPRKLAVSKVAQIRDAIVNYNSFPGWVDDGREKQVRSLAMAGWRARAIGDFWPYMLVAEGSVDVCGETDLQPYDIAALVPIVREAGGEYSSLDGDNSVWEGSALATNGILH